MIRAEGLQFNYSSEIKFNFPVVECASTEDLLILGPSGIGKTTLLHLLAGFLLPSEGKVNISGTILNGLKGNERDVFRSNHIGFVHQDNYFINAINVRENLCLAQTLAGNSKDIEKIQDLSVQLNVWQFMDKKPSELSRGEKQRVSIVRSLVNSPKVLLADEPTSSLDDKNCQNVVQMLKSRSKENNAALIIVTHDQRLKAQFKRTIEL